MKHKKLLFFPLALSLTCYIAYYSVQRNTLAPTFPLSALTIATTETQDIKKSFTRDVVNDLAHRMTQKIKFRTCSTERILYEVKKGQIHYALLPKIIVEQEKDLLIIPLENNSTNKVLVMSTHNLNLFQRTHATLLEMKEDGTLEDFAHKWHVA